jgi:hypothetical protein
MTGELHEALGLTTPSLIKLLGHKARSAAVSLLEKLAEHGEWQQHAIITVANVDTETGFMKHCASLFQHLLNCSSARARMPDRLLFLYLGIWLNTVSDSRVAIGGANVDVKASFMRHWAPPSRRSLSYLNIGTRAPDPPLLPSLKDWRNTVSGGHVLRS